MFVRGHPGCAVLKLTYLLTRESIRRTAPAPHPLPHSQATPDRPAHSSIKHDTRDDSRAVVQPSVIHRQESGSSDAALKPATRKAYLTLPYRNPPLRARPTGPQVLRDYSVVVCAKLRFRVWVTRNTTKYKCEMTKQAPLTRGHARGVY